MGRSRLQIRRGDLARPLVTQSYSQLILSHANLQSYWRLAETSGNFADSKGAVTGTNNLTASSTRGVTGLVTGDADKACTVAVGEKIDMGNVLGFSGTSAFTVEFLVKIPALSTGFLVSKANGATAQGGWGVQVLATGAIRFIRVLTTGIQNLDTATGVIAAATTYHIACTYDGTDKRVYVNGSLAAGPQASGTTNSGTPTFRIGTNSDQWGTSNPTATMDEVAIYNAALDLATIQAHYNKAGI